MYVKKTGLYYIILRTYSGTPKTTYRQLTILKK